MKVWKLVILLALSLMMASCTVEKQEGLWLASFVSCEERQTPQEGQPFKVQGYGRFDVAVSWYFGAAGSYRLQALIRNNLETSVNEEFGMGEGNNIFLRRVEVDFEVPMDWDPIERANIPLSGALGPGDSYMLEFNAIPSATRLQIEENFAKNAYKSAQPWSTMRPPVLDDSGDPFPCTNATAAEDCHGYRCDTKGDMEPDAKGTCTNGCTLRTGCADASYACDIGQGDYGFCRPSCVAGVNDCQAMRDPATGQTMVSFQCLRGTCIPAGTTVNPYDPDPVILRVRIIGQDPAGNAVGSNTLTFPLTVCRGCLLDFEPAACFCTPLDAQYKSCYEETTKITELGATCEFWRRQQDDTIYCAWLPGCWDLLCPAVIAERGR